MKKILHPAAARGFADHGWLKSYHSFSFASYYNPEKMHFGLLRVLNDDSVAPGRGFGAHPHDNMEIISIPLEGELEHQDNTGNKKTIRQGEVQIMSAGTGIVHAEYNASESQPVKFLQIWIFPKEKNIKPRYDQKMFPASGRENKLETVVSPDKDAESLWINQDARLSLGNFTEDKTLSYALPEGHGAYLFVLEGEVEAGGEMLGRRDAIGISETNEIEIKAAKGTQLLVIEVPMH